MIVEEASKVIAISDDTLLLLIFPFIEEFTILIVNEESEATSKSPQYFDLSKLK